MKGVQPARVADINFYGDKPKEKVVANNAPARRADPQPSPLMDLKTSSCPFLLPPTQSCQLGSASSARLLQTSPQRKLLSPHRKSLQGCGPFTEGWRVSIPLMRCTVPMWGKEHEQVARQQDAEGASLQCTVISKSTTVDSSSKGSSLFSLPLQMPCWHARVMGWACWR
ncbi:hypothetical protein CgunFtcFv8_001348 [Champsocephalus gunnari]|uniref:Uncharacterized protein n=1 Tax=Champsocephalus gunnari TaxID=52237 RepID=A0AAN8HQC7_CHAGU|nr:hypothetical protein CgunFtcFv8_001348 [Champsocephalus gunnari]